MIDTVILMTMLSSTIGATIGELLTPLQQNNIHDVGFIVVDKLPKRFFQNDMVILLNSVILLLCIGYVTLEAFFYGATTLVRHVVALYLLRFVVGFMTRLPVPPGAYQSPTDIPPKGSNFFFLFSAHTATITTVGLHVCEYWGWHLSPVFAIIILLQSIRLLSTRGHYSADIILAISLSVFLYI